MKIQEYKYKPPLKYLFVGLSGILASILFALAIGKDEIWFSIVIGIFSLSTLAVGIGFLTIFIRKFNVGKLRIGKEYIEIPGRWKNRTQVMFNEIENIGEFDTYDHIIEIQSIKGIFLIEKQWMKKNEFDELRKNLMELDNNGIFQSIRKQNKITEFKSNLKK